MVSNFSCSFPSRVCAIFDLQNFKQRENSIISKLTKKPSLQGIFYPPARRSERDSAELVYILCGADNPKTWIIMRNFRFDTGFITGFDAGNYLLNLLLGNRQLLCNLRACSNEFIHNFCRVSLAFSCRAEKKYERTLLSG